MRVTELPCRLFEGKRMARSNLSRCRQTFTSVFKTLSVIAISLWFVPGMLVAEENPSISNGRSSNQTEKQKTPLAIDPVSGLKIAPGWNVVKTQCTVCHSAQLIVSQQGDRDAWLSIIRWMQATQGLKGFVASTENTILRYLVANYPPGKTGRRANLPVNALPPNPWMTKSDP